MKQPTFRSRSFYDALRLLNSKAIRRRPMSERMTVMNAILSAIEVAIADAHMSGRIYNKFGERADPDVEHRTTGERAKRAAMAEYRRVMSEAE